MKEKTLEQQTRLRINQIIAYNEGQFKYGTGYRQTYRGTENGVAAVNKWNNSEARVEATKKYESKKKHFEAVIKAMGL